MTLPEGWVETTIGEVFTVNPKHPAETDRTQIISFVPMPAVDEHLGAITGPIDRTLSEIWTGYTHFADGDVIFAKITPCMENGKAAIAKGLTNGLACGSTEFYVFRSNDANLSDYLWRYLRQSSFREEAERHMSGAVGQRRVPRNYLEQHALPLPPLAEQRRIVAKLDALTARLARARAELDRVPVLAEKMRDCALQVAFPESAKTVRIDEVASRVTKGSSPGWQGYEYQAEGVLFVRSQNVRWGNLALEDQVYLPSAFNEKARNSVICENDVLLNIVGASIGRAAVATSALAGANCNQAVCIIRPMDGDDAKYMMYFLISPNAQTAITDGAVDVARANFSLAQAKSLRIPWPNAEARRSKVEKIESAFARADRLEAEAARARALLDRLEAAILARAFRGELVPQDPADEPASTLLARIRAKRAAAPKAKRGRKAKAA